MKDQVILVTGASRGLGAAIARAFGEQGAAVVVNYHHSAGKAAGVAAAVEAAGGRALAVQADVRDFEQVKAMVERAEAELGPVSVVVNNALVNYSFDPVARKDAFSIPWEDYQAQIDGTLRGAFNACRAALPGMRERRYGRIINVGTNLFQNPVVAYHDYTTAKAALVGFTRNLAAEVGQFNITVNLVAGGLLEETDASAATTKEVKDIVRSITPLRRITTPADVAGAVLFFASPWARAITGQSLVVDGGLVMD